MKASTLDEEIGKASQNWCHLSCHLKGKKKLFSKEGGIVGEKGKNAGVVNVSKCLE